MNEIKNNVLNKIKETRSLWKEVYDWVDCAVITIICVILLFTFCFRQVEIDGSSMSNTLEHGDRILISNIFYTPKKGDVVVVSSEIYDNVPIIKRVIAPYRPILPLYKNFSHSNALSQALYYSG